MKGVYWRFNVFHRFIHLVMLVTFVGLLIGILTQQNRKQ